MNKPSCSRPRVPSLRSLCAPAIAVLLGSHALAQCGTQWLPGPALAGTNGGLGATIEWDPDGAGPLPPLLVAGGTFTAAGDVAANNVAAYDATTRTWQP